MAATLGRNGKDEKSTPSNIPVREIIRCSSGECEYSYVLCNTDDEQFLSGRELNTQKMYRLAVALIENEHPDHITKNHVWKGAKRGWGGLDSMAERMVL